MTALDALETIDKSADKLELFNTLLSDSLDNEGTCINLRYPALRGGLYHFINDVADDLRAAERAIDLSPPLTQLAESGVHLNGILDALVLGYKACCLGIYGPDKRGEFIKRHIDPLNWYLNQQGIDTGLGLSKDKSASGGAA